MAIKRTKQTISKESMFNKIMPSLSKDEKEEETAENVSATKKKTAASDDGVAETVKKAAKKTTAAKKATAAKDNKPAVAEAPEETPKKTAKKTTSSKKTAAASEETAAETKKKTTKKTTTSTAKKTTKKTEEAETESAVKETAKKTATKKKTAAKKVDENETLSNEAPKKTAAKKKTTAKKSAETKTDAAAESIEEVPQKTAKKTAAKKKSTSKNTEEPETENNDAVASETSDIEAAPAGIQPEINGESENSVIENTAELNIAEPNEEAQAGIESINEPQLVNADTANETEQSNEIVSDSNITLNEEPVEEEIKKPADKPVPKVSAYARQLVERKDDRDNGDYSEYEVININEELMKVRFNDIFDKFHCCHCNGCRFTVMALSLNLLEAKYIAVKSSEREDIIKHADDSHIKSTIIQSILKLMINPIH